MKAPEIHALPQWQRVDFISDIHLHASDPLTRAAWDRYLDSSDADALFILGDLFDVWVGDDALEEGAASAGSPSSFERDCVAQLQRAAQRLPVYVMHGNRDFLLSSDFARLAQVHLIADPCVLVFGGKRYLLSHGDALCVADQPYQAFRAMVRSAEWQQTFLARSLTDRRAQAKAMRSASEDRKAQQSATGQAWIDVDVTLAKRWMDELDCDHFIHGHTHEGRDHPLPASKALAVRHVLSDWDLQHTPPRGFVLRLLRADAGEPVSQHLALP